MTPVEELRIFQAETGRSNAGMADLMGVHPETYGKWIRGQRRPPAVARRFLAWLRYQWDLERGLFHKTERGVK